MATVIHCPDCGGVVGATGTTDAGPPCTCFVNEFDSPSSRVSASPSARFNADLGSDFDDGAGSGASDGASASPPGEVNSGTQVMDSPVAPKKVCIRCGKDLSGHRRFKDSFGYWCKDCHRADKAEKVAAEPQGVPCELCFRSVAEDSLTSFDGKRLCSRCLKEKRDMRKAGAKKFRAVSDKAYRKTELQKLLIMVGVLLVLGAIVLARSMHWIGGR
jgi:hypothetical protein